MLIEFVKSFSATLVSNSPCALTNGVTIDQFTQEFESGFTRIFNLERDGMITFRDFTDYQAPFFGTCKSPINKTFCDVYLPSMLSNPLRFPIVPASQTPAFTHF